jgi:hypothetical protein
MPPSRPQVFTKCARRDCYYFGRDLNGRDLCASCRSVAERVQAVRKPRKPKGRTVSLAQIAEAYRALDPESYERGTQIAEAAADGLKASRVLLDAVARVRRAIR